MIFVTARFTIALPSGSSERISAPSQRPGHLCVSQQAHRLCSLVRDQAFRLVEAVPLKSLQLLQVRLNDLDQLFRACSAGAPFVRWVKYVRADVIFDHFRHKAVHGAPRRHDEMKHCGTAALLVHCAFKRFDLTANTSNAVQQFSFFFDSMAHSDARL